MIKKPVAALKPTSEPETHIDNEGDALMVFRTAWMRAIALAWMNKTEKALIAKPLEFLGDGWPKEWDRLTLEVEQEKTFIWVGDTWTWVEDPQPPTNGHARGATAAGAKEDELRIWLPLSPKTAGIPEAEYGIALAEYYKHRSSIFTKCAADSARRFLSRTIDGSQGFMKLLADGPIHWQPKGSPRDGFMPTHTSFANFSVALMSALAKSWTVENFGRRLLEDAESALHSTREFAIPWKMKIRIKNDPKPKWISKELRWDFKGEGTNVLALCLPVRPTSGSNQALALAAYNASGAEYPFTCCP